MAGYIGSKASVVSSGAERKKTFTITGATTSLTGLNYTVGKVHVFQNGVRLVDGTDYTATNGTTITLTVAAQSGDNVVVLSQASFQVADALLITGGTLTGDLSFGDNDKAIFGAGSDLQIYHDGTHSYLDNNTGALFMRNNGSVVIEDLSGDNIIRGIDGGAVDLYHNGSAKLATTSTGIAVTGSTAHTAGDITNTISGTYNLNGANGTAGSPAYATYSFKDDPNTGMYRGGADTLAFTTNGSERMRLDSSGRLMLGTTAPFSGSNGSLYIETDAVASRNLIAMNNTGSGTNAAGVVALYRRQNFTGGITNTYTSTQFNTSSDYRLKENVVDLTGASARVNQLNPSRFNFIADADTTVDGFLAHEVADVVPEAITGTKDAMKDEEYEVTPATGDIYTPATEAYVDDDGNDVDAVDEVIHSADAEQPETLEDGQQWRETTAAVMGTRSVPDYQGIDQSKLVPLLTAALQEALTEISSLKTRVEALEA